jgi:hypothetical protein
MLRTIVVTGGDELFAHFMLESIASLIDIGVLDQGLSETSRASVSALGIRIASPEWPSFVPTELKDKRQIGLLNRPFLRDLFPGYDVYLWFDADAWAQNAEFLDIYVQGAARDGAAVALENGAGYRKSWREIKWWMGNYIAAYGPVSGVRLALKSSINIGILSIRDNAPHWASWIAQYKQTIEKTSKLNLDQHAFHATVHLGQCKTSLLPARMNWLPILSTPMLNKGDKILREPGGKEAISIVHLAGPDKRRTYALKGDSGVSSPLDYRTFRSVQD